MKTLTMAAAIIGTVAVLSMGNAPRAVAAEDFVFSFNTGDVAFAYDDGYWDHDHHWHRWHNARESREYRTRFADNYHHWRHNRDHDGGWHEEHHDEDHR